MKKRIFVACQFILSSFMVWAYDVKIDDIYYYLNADAQEAQVTTSADDIASYSGEVVIPSSITHSGVTYLVTRIGHKAFRNCSGLTSIIIPESVTSIGYWAFQGCSSLTSVVIPESVTNIHGYAFQNCSGLTSINIPNNLTSIGEEAFAYCKGLTSIYIPNSVKTIGEDAFFCCDGLTSVTINSNPIVSDSYAWGDGMRTMFGNQVKEYVLGEGVTTIGRCAFSRCENLTSITIPKTVTSIGNSAFEGCLHLKKVIIEDIESWCNLSFDGIRSNPLSHARHLYLDEHTEVTELVFPDGTTNIGDYAFYGCAGLTSVILPNGITHINNSTFSGCTGLTSVNIPQSVTNICENAFSGCSGLTSVILPDGLIGIEKGAFSECSNLTSIIIPRNITSIVDGTFSDCSSLSSITIPHGVSVIEHGAFSGCEGLTTVTLNSQAIVSQNYASNDNIKNIFGNQVTSYIIGDGITSIGDNAFAGCTGLTSITIPDYVECIGTAVFEGCINLEKVIIKDLASWCKLNFDGILSNPLSYAHHLYGDEHTEITELVLPEGTTNIGDYTFYGCSGLTSLTIPEGVTNINHSAFYDCSGLTSVIIPHSVENIGHHAFFNCSGLTSLMIPESVTSIGDYAFIGCSSLASINVDERNTVYDSRNNSNAIIETASNTLLQGCNFTTIPSGVTSISYWAFRQCLGLSSIIIPNSVKEIGMVAFDGCSNLKDVYCHAENIPTASASIFDNVKLKESTLHVPTVSIELYQHTIPWSSFGKIVPLTPEEEALGINASTTTKSQIQQIYTPTGQAVNTLQPGVNIIRYSNGQVKKVQGR